MVCCYRQTFIIFPPHSAVECVVPTAAAAAYMYMALIMNFICNATGVQKKSTHGICGSQTWKRMICITRQSTRHKVYVRKCTQHYIESVVQSQGGKCNTFSFYIMAHQKNSCLKKVEINSTT